MLISVCVLSHNQTNALQRKPKCLNTMKHNKTQSNPNRTIKISLAVHIKNHIKNFERPTWPHWCSYQVFWTFYPQYTFSIYLFAKWLSGKLHPFLKMFFSPNILCAWHLFAVMPYTGVFIFLFCFKVSQNGEILSVRKVSDSSELTLLLCFVLFGARILFMFRISLVSISNILITFPKLFFGCIHL